MSDDNTKPEPRHWARALADVPDAGTIGERHAITFELLGAIGNELAAQRSAVVPAVPAIADGKAETTGDSDAHRRQLARWAGGCKPSLMAVRPPAQRWPTAVTQNERSKTLRQLSRRWCCSRARHPSSVWPT